MGGQICEREIEGLYARAGDKTIVKKHYSYGHRMFQFCPIGCLRSHFSDGEVVLRGNAEGIGDAIEEGEHGDDVDGLSDLVFGPAGGTKFSDIFGSGTVGGFGDELGVVQQSALRLGQASFIELAFENGCDSLIGGSLNPQEVSVAVQSIRTAIEE